MKIFLISD